MKIYQKIFKRILDIFLSSFAIIVLLPVLIIIAILVELKLGSPIIFKQPRPGKNEKIFYLYKFRSMTNATDEDGKLLPDKDRLTKFGKFLRKSSIDELPELFNILKGDMSIVGPRPQSMYSLQYYYPLERRRQEVRPGLTGLAQIHGRNNLPWENRFELDLKYVENISFLNDCKIIFDTFAKVFKGSDVEVRDNNVLKNFTSYRIVNEEKTRNRNNMTTYSEIGSYFWLDPNIIENLKSQNSPINWLPETKDKSYTYSGRNAIKLALKDIQAKQQIKKAYIPSYCCLSMLQPFIELNITYEFYDVILENGNFKYYLPSCLNHENVVLIMSYFGADITIVNQEIEKIMEKGCNIIEDISHSLFSKNGYSPFSNYLIASLRKWFPVPSGGWIGKKYGKLFDKPDKNSDHAVEGKIDGMIEKFDYISGKITEKEDFLIKNAKFDGELAKAKDDLTIDSLSLNLLKNIDIDSIKEQRKNNAKILINGLKELDINVIELLDIDYNKVTPLFVPIFLPKDKRDSLRHFLISKGIYCPVHWPEILGTKPGIRENELSLICDQRYSEPDMLFILDSIKEWKSNL